MRQNKFSVFFVMMFCCGIVFSQQLLTIEEAIQIALKNNFSIIVSKNQTEIAKNEAIPGNAGMLPSLAINASGGWSQNNTKQKFATGGEIDRDGAISKSILSGLELSWTLFDGMRMFAAYDRLKDASAMSEIALKIEIENVVEQVIVNYFSLVKQKQLIKAMENDLLFYEQRLSIADTKLKIGSGSKIDYLQAKVDLNEKKSLFLTQKKVAADLKVSLNKFLNRPPDVDFDVAEEIPVQYNPAYEELKTTMAKSNNQILLYQNNNLFYEHTLKEIRAQRYPSVFLRTNYNFSTTENQAGFIMFNQNLGLNATLSLSWTIFNGLNTQRQIKNASIQLANSKLMYDETRMLMDAELLTAYNEFKNLHEIYLLEQENIKFAKENTDVSFEAFKQGAISSILLKQAQQSYENALLRLVNVRYDLKVAETRLMKLNGVLVAKTP